MQAFPTTPPGIQTVTTLPSDNKPYGSVVLWQRTNGLWEMRWDGSAWIPWATIGPCTVYVNTSGTNGQSYGDGTGANAYADPQYAWSATPRYIDPESYLLISCANQTFTQAARWSFDSKLGGRVRIKGTPTVAYSGLAHSSNSTGLSGVITFTTSPMTSSAHINHIAKVNSSSGTSVDEMDNQCLAISANATNTITVCDSTTTYTGATFDILSPGTKFAGTYSGAVPDFVVYANGNSNLTFEGIEFENQYMRIGEGSTLYRNAIVAEGDLKQYNINSLNNAPNTSGPAFLGCWFDETIGITSWFLVSTYLYAIGCVWTCINSAGTCLQAFLPAASSSLFPTIGIRGCIFDRLTGTKVGNAIIVDTGFKAACYRCFIDNFSVGVNVSRHSYMQLQECRVQNCTNGIAVANNSTFYRAGTSYSGNTTNEAAAATSGIYA